MPDDTIPDDANQPADQELRARIERVAQIGTLSMLLTAAVKRSDQRDQILDLFRCKVADCVKEIRQGDEYFSAALADEFESQAQVLLSGFEQTSP